MQSSNEEKLSVIINEVLQSNGKPALSKISLDDYLKDDLGFDSVEMVDLVVSIEDEFNTDIFEFGSIKTVREIYNLINKNEIL